MADNALRDQFWELPLDHLTRAEWEALCDGCGKCCLHKLEDEETGRVYPTNIACRLLNLETAQCCNYKARKKFVPDCLQLTPKSVADLPWLPLTCAYRLRQDGAALPDWHYLISGDRDAVHAAGESIRGWTVPETLAGPMENHLVDRAV
jgi:uncharacterized protein